MVVGDGEGEDTSPYVRIEYDHWAVDDFMIHPPQGVQFYSSIQGGDGDLQYLWSFNSTPISTEADPEIYFRDMGTFLIQLNVTDEDGDEGSDRLEIETGPYIWMITTSHWQVDPGNEFPIGDEYSGSIGEDLGRGIYLTAYPRIGPAPLRVVFNSGGYRFGDGSFFSSELDFGDGTSYHYPCSTNEHEYDVIGDYTVTLSIAFRTGMEDGDGNPICTYENVSCNITVLQTMEIVDEGGIAQSSSLHIMADPEEGISPLTVELRAVLGQGVGTGGSYFWDFGDGEHELSFDGTIQHTYRSIGQLTATVTYRRGLSLISDQLIINISSPAYLINAYCMIMVHPEDGPYDLGFFAWTSHQVLSYSWTIDGASYGTTREVRHDFSGESGIHIIRLDVLLNVTLADGSYLHIALNDTTMVVVPGDQTVSVYFEPSFSTVMTYEPVRFDSWVSGGNAPLSFNWFFGDGGSSHLFDPMYVYTNPGRYTVDLYVVDADGDVGHSSHDIVVVERSEIPG